VVYEDADLDAAVAGLANAIFFNSGQCCTPALDSTSKRPSTTTWWRDVAEAARGIKVGPAFEADSQIGPLVSAEQLDRVRGYLDSGASQGAKALAGGGRHGYQGFFVEPTLADKRPREHAVVKKRSSARWQPPLPSSGAGSPSPKPTTRSTALAAAVWDSGHQQSPQHRRRGTGGDRVDQHVPRL